MPGAAQAVWEAFCRAAQVTDARFVVASFGDSAKMADALLELVLCGAKRATATLAREFDRPGGDPLPRPGDYVVWLDGSGRPRCITRTTHVEVKPLSQVDDAFAFAEGEGDRTRAFWLAAHRDYFARRLAREGLALHDDVLTVFERFAVVWVADGARPGEGAR